MLINGDLSLGTILELKIQTNLQDRRLMQINNIIAPIFYKIQLGGGLTHV